MKNFFLLLILSTGFYTASAQQTPNPFRNAIGSTYKKIDDLPQFKGYKHELSVMMLPVDNAWSISAVKKHNHMVVLLERILPDGKFTKSKIIDLVDLGDVGSATILIASCKIDGKEDRTVFALGNHSIKDNFKTVTKAWRANKATGKIEAISAKGISCINYDYTETD